jgi:hypothetical protein
LHFSIDADHLLLGGVNGAVQLSAAGIQTALRELGFLRTAL